MVLAQKHVNQWNRIKDPEISPHNYSHLNLNIGNKNGIGKTGYPHVTG
jgi:hypothetical protein